MVTLPGTRPRIYGSQRRKVGQDPMSDDKKLEKRADEKTRKLSTGPCSSHPSSEIAPIPIFRPQSSSVSLAKQCFVGSIRAVTRRANKAANREIQMCFSGTQAVAPLHQNCGDFCGDFRPQKNARKPAKGHEIVVGISLSCWHHGRLDCLQGAVSNCSWGFKSPLRHFSSPFFVRFRPFPPFLTFGDNAVETSHLRPHSCSPTVRKNLSQARRAIHHPGLGTALACNPFGPTR